MQHAATTNKICDLLSGKQKMIISVPKIVISPPSPEDASSKQPVADAGSSDSPTSPVQTIFVTQEGSCAENELERQYNASRQG